MKYDVKNIVLKNGMEVILRSPDANDGKRLSVFEIQRTQETEFMLRDPDECLNEEDMKVFINTMESSKTDIMIVCENDNQIVGCCELVRKNLRKTFHRAELSIGNLKAYWGLGIGKMMFEELITVAKQHGITQLELNVFEGNDSAIGLYKKMGFEVVAERPNCIHLSDGSRLKAYTMFLTLE